jgi:CheY-like chemotaxis protein
MPDQAPSQTVTKPLRDIEGATIQRPYVLVVEDEAGIVQALRDALEDDGYQVCAVTDAPQAFASLRTCTPHLVLLDLMLPGMSGEEFLRIYRELPGTHAPVIVLTAAGHGAQQRAEALGAELVLAKPYSVESLLNVIAQHLRPDHYGS